MSLPLAIAVIVLLDAALIGLLVFVMSRASSLTPHLSSTDAGETRTSLAPSTHGHHAARPANHSSRIGSSAIPARS
ncbi:MAG TPA: hypothetical protein VGN25_08160 [Solirubrobacteraceae bacterium]|jgi:hypothetical protein|nr:hypothetical protein [Solirubrobacteraceae bacterium]